MDLDNGIYQLIATCPYGTCKTSVREILGTRSPTDVIITVAMKPTDQLGVLVGAPRVRVSVVSKDMHPVAGLPMLVRDEQAVRQQWYTTDARGSADVALPSDPAVLIIVHQGNIYRYVLSERCSTSDTPDVDCYDPARNRIVLEASGQ